MTNPDHSAAGAHNAVPFRSALRVWLLIGLESFGGPAGQIAVMHRRLVDQHRWISETRFLHALNYCMLLPGPEAMQLATYVGWLMHRTIGGLAAGILFVLPGFSSILVLSLLYAGFRDIPIVEGLFFGLKPAVLAVVLQAVFKIGRRALNNAVMWMVAGGAFIAIFAFAVPFPLIILAAAGLGWLGSFAAPSAFCVLNSRHTNPQQRDQSILGDSVPPHTLPSFSRSARTLFIWLSLWILPIVALRMALGSESVYFQQSIFFSTAAVVTFGGAYSVLAYVAQQAVEIHHWLQPNEMLDGLGMAETTPGPLIQVVQFVGFMGAYRHAGQLNPFLAGTMASLVVTWVTFVPCFLWVFLGGPYIESLRSNRSLTAALSAITAAVVGVILNLAIWFAMHTLYSSVHDFQKWGMKLALPEPNSIQWPAVGVAILAGILLFRFKLPMLATLLVCALLGVAWTLMVPRT